MTNLSSYKNVIETVELPKEPALKPRKAKKRVSKKAVNSIRKTPTKKVKQKKEVKFPVDVKRLSKELQLIKRMAAMDGKRKTVKAITSLHREVNKTLRSNPDRKPVLKDIQNRLKVALSKARKVGVRELDIKLDLSFKRWLLENIKNPRPKMKVEYLAGVEKKKVFNVSSSNGDFTVDSTSGKVVEYSPSVDADPTYKDIQRFDVAEWKKRYPKKSLEKSNIDILDLGYWMKDGAYEEPAEDWREEFGGK